MTWIVMIVIGVATFALRASFLVFVSGQMRPRVERALRFVPAAVLPALAVSAVIGQDGSQLDLRLLAAVLAALVAWRTRNAAAAMVLGMGALWALQALA